MSHSRILVAAAVLAFGTLAASPVMAGGMSGGPSKNGGGGCHGNCGGGGGGGGYTRIICIVNGRRFEVTDEGSCSFKRQYHREYRIIRHFERHITFRHARKAKICGCAYAQGGYEGGYEGGYSGYGYYTGGGSTAAQMQAERRSQGYAMTDGGVYYGQDEGGYDQPRRHLKKRRYYGGYEAGYTYDPGYVIHYGPTIAKDGGY